MLNDKNDTFLFPVFILTRLSLENEKLNQPSIPPPLKNFLGHWPSPPLQNFQFPLWWGYGYFLEPHISYLNIYVGNKWKLQVGYHEHKPQHETGTCTVYTQYLPSCVLLLVKFKLSLGVSSSKRLNSSLLINLIFSGTRIPSASKATQVTSAEVNSNG